METSCRLKADTNWAIHANAWLLNSTVYALCFNFLLCALFCTLIKQDSDINEIVKLIQVPNKIGENYAFSGQNHV